MRERPRHQRLGQSRIVVDEHVAVGKEPEQHEPQRIPFPDDRPLDFVEDGLGCGAIEVGGRLVEDEKRGAREEGAG